MFISKQCYYQMSLVRVDIALVEAVCSCINHASASSVLSSVMTVEYFGPNENRRGQVLTGPTCKF